MVYGLGDRIREQRQKRRLTQKELAAILHVTNAAISAYEKGERQPQISVLMQIASFFRVTTDYLLGLETKERMDISDLTEMQKSTIYELIDKYKSSNSIKD